MKYLIGLLITVMSFSSFSNEAVDEFLFSNNDVQTYIAEFEAEGITCDSSFGHFDKETRERLLDRANQTMACMKDAKCNDEIEMTGFYDLYMKDLKLTIKVALDLKKDEYPLFTQLECTTKQGVIVAFAVSETEETKSYRLITVEKY